MLYKFKTFIAASVLSISVGANVQAAVLTVGTGGFSLDAQQSAVKNLEKWNTISSRIIPTDLQPIIGQANQNTVNAGHSFWLKTNALQTAAPVITTEPSTENVQQSVISMPATISNTQLVATQPDSVQENVANKVEETKTEQKSEQIAEATEQPVEKVVSETPSELPEVANTELKVDEQVPSEDEINTSTETSETADTNTAKELTVTATAYTASCEGCSGITATGVNIKSDPNQKVIAVDPKVIPLGTKVYVEGYGEAVAADTGGAIKGNRIDVFIPEEQDAMDWGRKEVKLQIIN
ncbi:3D domain-containing protein [Neobacillus dielmonensis]|uniref:3D domain-containing protein n=1 Tax=Neobacillus dielmonensis TaxID=1347369 RepID=UPI0005A818B0|nr:3D domain-containing protein [Neobacillus dielmonensis]